MRIAPDWKDYSVIATGDGEKLERWGKYVLLRPDPQVIWRASKPLRSYKGIDAVLFPFHKANQFIGMSPLPTFMCNDVVKAPHITEDIERYRKHLQQLFGHH